MTLEALMDINCRATQLRNAIESPDTTEEELQLAYRQFLNVVTGDNMKAVWFDYFTRLCTIRGDTVPERSV